MKKETVSIISLGCPKNLVDSERIVGDLIERNYRFTYNPDKADIIIINTCAFLSSARKEAQQVISDFIERKKEGKVKKVIVSGCYPSLDCKYLKKKYQLIDGITGTNNLGDIIKAMEEGGIFVSNRTEEKVPPRMKLTLPHYAYLKIADGCNHLCSFCLIPSIKGCTHSLPIEELVREVRVLALTGVRELILIAQDTTQYGVDLYGTPKLVELLKEIEKIEGIEWIRVMYTYPSTYVLNLLDYMKKSKKVVPYLDIPIQHISNKILKSMKRGYTREFVTDILKALRESGIVLRTSVIVGYPGETMEDFRRLENFIEDFRFDHLGIFEYSNEKGTESFSLAKQVDGTTRSIRYEKLVDLEERIDFERNKSFIGKTIPVVVDFFSEREGLFIGRTIYDAPEVDNTVSIHEKVSEGQFYKGVVENIAPHNLKVKIRRGKD